MSSTPTSDRSPGKFVNRFGAFVSIIILLLLATNAPAQKRKESAHRTVKQYSIEQFMDTVKIQDSSFSQDEKSILFSSNKSGIFNVYSMPISGGEPRQLTNSTKESTFAVSYFPTDSRFLFQFDQGGNENSHLHVMGLDGVATDLTPGEKTKAWFYGWSRDKQSFFFSTNERDPRFFDIYEMTIADFKRTLLYQDTTGLDFQAISPDKANLAFNKPNTTVDSDIYIYNVAGKSLKNITQHQGDINHSPETFDLASRYFYYLTDEGSEVQYVARYDLASGKKETVEKAQWDISGVSFSRNGKYRIVTINADARTQVKLYEVATGKLVALPKLPSGDITAISISRSEKLMSFYLNGSSSPNDLYVYDFSTRKAIKLTTSLNPEIKSSDLVQAEVIRYKSFDGMEIPSILYKPHQASPQNKVPALVWVHGGPGGQTRTTYSAFMQYLVNHGYVILGVNNRGSSGYGKTFFAADDQKHGREPLWDCVEAKKYLASLGYVDESKIGIIGGSYGGYMVLAALAFKPDEFGVGVDIFGVSNWLRTLESIPPYWESFRKALYKEMGNPESDKDNLRAISPLFHADKIRKPLIVLQGANDPRVIKPESDEIVEAVKKNNGVVEYVVFDNEGHGFTKKANEIRGYKAVLDFLDRYLKNSGSTN